MQVDKTSLDVYFSDPVHRRATRHYVGYYASNCEYLLTFSHSWLNKYLPSLDCNERGALRVVLLDTEDGKNYETWMVAAYEQFPLLLGPTEQDVFLTLQGYFYSEHHCSCHRKSAALQAGANTDEECEGNRFLIERIEAPNLPGLVLYSETMSLEELEASLARNIKVAS